MNERTIARLHKTGAPGFTALNGPIMQQKCACREKREGVLQRAAIDTSFTPEVPHIVHEVLHSPGQALDAATSVFTNSRFSHVFSGVQ